MAVTATENGATTKHSHIALRIILLLQLFDVYEPES